MHYDGDFIYETENTLPETLLVVLELSSALNNALVEVENNQEVVAKHLEILTKLVDSAADNYLLHLELVKKEYNKQINKPEMKRIK